MTTPLDAEIPGAPPGLADRLNPVLAGEPPVGDAIDEIFGRAEQFRRRCARAVLAAGVALAGVVAATGYALTGLLLPAAPAHTAAPAPPPRPDRIRALLATTLRPSGMTVVAGEPAGGTGWRQYRVRTAGGRPYGLVEVSVQAAPEGLCFPVRADPRACARPAAAAGAQYVRYVADRDPNWQVVEVIARRLGDGRTIVVQATGERGTGDRAAGRPPLNAPTAARFATDPRLAAGFDAAENCDGTRSCPVLRVPLRIG